MAAGDANVSVGGTSVVVGGADVAAGDAAVDSSAILSSAAAGETLSNFFFNLFSIFAFLHFPQVIASTRSTVTPLARAHVLHSLKLGQQMNAKSIRSFLPLQLVHFIRPVVLAVEDPPSEDANEQASAPW